MTLAITKDFPTTNQWRSYQGAFDYFNATLFNNELPRCILNFSRRRNSYGFFTSERWESGEQRTHEISLNPDLLSRPMDATMATLNHEMVHLWQYVYGKPGRSTYHNREWGQKMEEIGLIPSQTGQPGGKKTGNRVTHYIEEGGRFAIAFANMPNDYLLPWGSAAGETSKESARKKKIKYSCLTCQTNVWGKPNLCILCEQCNEKFVVIG